MCLILISNSQELKKEHLETGRESNKDGSGFMYAKNGELFIEKGFFDFESFHKEYLEKCIGNPHVVHFRFGTSGPKDKDNCHPFLFLDREYENKLQAAVAHNGTISGHNEIANRSDTFNFVEKRLKTITKETKGNKWWKNIGFKWAMEGAIGHNNRLVFLDSDGEIIIYNERSGEWIDKENGIWASNDMYKLKKSRPGQTILHDDWDYRDLNHGMSRRSTLGLPEPKSNLNTTNTDTIDADSQTENATPRNTENLFDVSDEELAEVDKYLEMLNSM